MTRSRVFGLSGQSAAGSESARLTVALESRHRRAISAIVTPEARSEAVERAIEGPFNSWRCNRLQLDHATVAGATDFHRDRGGRIPTNNRDHAKRAKNCREERNQESFLRGVALRSSRLRDFRCSRFPLLNLPPSPAPRGRTRWAASAGAGRFVAAL